MTAAAALGSSDGPFWSALDRGVLALPCCDRCGTWIWPARPLCSACHAFELSWVEVEATGTVYSWTRTWYPFLSERTASLPYVVVVAELAHAGGCRLLGVLDVDGSAAADGAVGEMPIDESTEPIIGAPVVGRIHPGVPESLGLPSLRWVLR